MIIQRKLPTICFFHVIHSKVYYRFASRNLSILICMIFICIFDQKALQVHVELVRSKLWMYVGNVE